MNPSERFWRSVNRRGPVPRPGLEACWLWTAGRRGGYGRLRVDGRDQAAHRVSWVLHHGPVPNGLMVLHHCDVRPCVNPAHLFLGTAGDNARDAVSKGRHAAQQHPELFRRGIRTAIKASLRARRVRAHVRTGPPCIRCGGPTKKKFRAGGRCHACALYLYRNGVERPEAFFGRPRGWNIAEAGKKRWALEGK